jgi:hypothetical protein
MVYPFRPARPRAFTARFVRPGVEDRADLRDKPALARSDISGNSLASFWGLGSRSAKPSSARG